MGGICSKQKQVAKAEDVKIEQTTAPADTEMANSEISSSTVRSSDIPPLGDPVAAEIEEK